MIPEIQEQSPYVLGHSDSELRRLIDQSRFFGDLTEQVLRKAGLRKGMRVLDLGCGVGDVSFSVAALVGSSGHVLGVDKAPESIAWARKRARSAGLRQCTFETADLAAFRLKE